MTENLEDRFIAKFTRGQNYSANIRILYLQITKRFQGLNVFGFNARLIAEFGLRFCFVFLTIAALSFLGVGIQPPTADWGSMVRENASLIMFAQYDIKAGLTPLLPAAAIALLTVAINFVVDWFLHKTSGLRDEQ